MPGLGDFRERSVPQSINVDIALWASLQRLLPEVVAMFAKSGGSSWNISLTEFLENWGIGRVLPDPWGLQLLASDAL